MLYQSHNYDNQLSRTDGLPDAASLPTITQTYV
jgi:hypothetical protein